MFSLFCWIGSFDRKKDDLFFFIGIQWIHPFMYLLNIISFEKAQKQKRLKFPHFKTIFNPISKKKSPLYFHAKQLLHMLGQKYFIFFRVKPTTNFNGQV